MRPLLITCLLALPTIVRAELKTEEVRYSHGGTEFVGHLAWDDKFEGKRPGVLVVHEWWGLNDYAKKRAEQLAGLGYVAFAADMYGAGQVFEHPREAGAMAGKVRENVQTWRGRAQAALDVLKKHQKTDPQRLAAIGYCFGGSTALQLAYSGADLDAVVTFHAALPAASPQEAKAIKSELLINHGAADSFIPREAVDAFKKPLDGAGKPWTFVSYAGAKHGFTVPDADKKGLEGLAYNRRADEQSWAGMLLLF
jgi:dienelactone hydrolase